MGGNCPKAGTGILYQEGSSFSIFRERRRNLCQPAVKIHHQKYAGEGFSSNYGGTGEDQRPEGAECIWRSLHMVDFSEYFSLVKQESLQVKAMAPVLHREGLLADVDSL